MGAVEAYAGRFSEELARSALRELRELDRRGRPLRHGERMIPCGCWEHPVPHVAEAHPVSGWRVLWRCTGCRHLKG